ncbi:hypothetical protein N7468_008761 [Penicillium chermesinum]|uniref:Uncharacterized protein n=1 Tax=Penicillium chermesinum TaxID=63820 RepID=A0A9W9TE74_9EURO|nr:uncharacterized protein N7468_008761 [Penicillium chermesinum]KAJ5219557.1 hypothetical protein N7468_008761 [Penicillium chermesinum]
MDLSKHSSKGKKEKKTFFKTSLAKNAAASSRDPSDNGGYASSLADEAPLLGGSPAVSDSGDPIPEPEPTPEPEEELVWRLVSFRYRIDKDIHVGRMIRRLREKQDRLEEKFDEAHAKL